MVRISPTVANGWRPKTNDEWQYFRETLESYIDHNLSDFIVNIRYDLLQRWDRIIIVTGKRGVGKSTLSIMLAKLIDYSFTFDRLAFQPEDIMPIFLNMSQYQSMIMDEGGEIWNRAEWATRVSKTITKQVIGDRWLYSCRFILAPTIFHLDKRAIDMADYWIHVSSPNNRLRGFAEVRMMSEKDFIDKKLPYAPSVMDIRFSDLPKSIADMYRNFKTKKGLERAQKYSKIIEKETGSYEEMEVLDLDAIAEEVLFHKDKFIGRNERFSWRLIYGEYQKQGLGQERAQTIAVVLNRGIANEAG